MLTKKEYQLIIKVNKRNLKRDPNNGESLKELGDAYFNLGNYKNALATFQRYLNNINPEAYEVWNKIGAVYMQKGDKKSAIQAFKRALGINQGYDLAWANLGNLNFQMKNYEQAVQQLSHACDLSPDKKDYWVTLGSCQFNIKSYKDAIISYKKALNLDRTYDQVWQNLANTYKKVGEKKKMKEALNQNWAILEETYSSLEERKERKELENRLDKVDKIINKKQYEKAVKELKIIIQEVKSFESSYLDVVATQANSRLEECEDILSQRRRAEEGKSIERELEKSLSQVGKLVKKEQYSKAKSILYAVVKSATEYELDIILAQANREFDIVDDLEFDQRFKSGGDADVEKFNKKEIEVLRGGDWKIEESQSIFYYKPKIINNSKYVITNIQILLTQIPSCLVAESERYKIESLRPRAFEAPTFKLKALESCVGDRIGGIITYTTPSGGQETIDIDSFEIKYVCNLLIPKQVSSKEFEKKTKHMKDKKLILDFAMDPTELQEALAPVLQQNNFYLLEQLKHTQSSDFRTLQGFAKGRYDQEDVAVALTMEKQDEGTQLIIKGMSELEGKLTDILRDISVKCDDIKSDTELIKEYASQIEDLFDKVDDMEVFLMQRLGSDFQKLKSAWQDYKDGKTNKKGLIVQGIKILGMRFIKSCVPIVKKVT